MELKYMLATDSLQYYNPRANKHICKVCGFKFKLAERAYKHIENKHWQEVTDLSNSDIIKEKIK